MRRLALLTAFATSLLAAAPGHAFEVQSGGIPLSAAHMALLAGRMAGAAQAKSGPADSRPMPPWMAGREAKTAESANGPSSMLGFMLGDRRAEARPAAGKEPFGAKGFAARR